MELQHHNTTPPTTVARPMFRAELWNNERWKDKRRAMRRAGIECLRPDETLDKIQARTDKRRFGRLLDIIDESILIPSASREEMLQSMSRCAAEGCSECLTAITEVA